jgi:hypothetical protein
MLERVAARVADDDAFVASALRDWAGGHLDLESAASFLGCGRKAVLQLALCRRPPGMSTSFRREVAQIAAYTCIDEMRLLELLREAASIAAFRRSDGAPILAAARDARDPKKEGGS